MELHSLLKIGNELDSLCITARIYIYTEQLRDPFRYTDQRQQQQPRVFLSLSLSELQPSQHPRPARRPVLPVFLFPTRLSSIYIYIYKHNARSSGKYLAPGITYVYIRIFYTQALLFSLFAGREGASRFILLHYKIAMILVTAGLKFFGRSCQRER